MGEVAWVMCVLMVCEVVLFVIVLSWAGKGDEDNGDGSGNGGDGGGRGVGGVAGV